MRYEPSSRPRLLCPLFIPGNRPDMLAKASRFDASAFVPDFEDSVPSAAKDDAVEVTARAMPELVAIGKPIIPRVNGLTTGRTQSELEAVVGTGIVGVSIGKVMSSEELRQVSDMIDTIEKTKGVKPGATLILPWIETAAAVVNAFDICSASPRVGWVAFGAEDYAADMGIMREVDTDPPRQDLADEHGEASLLYARSAVAVAARRGRRRGARHTLREVQRLGRSEVGSQSRTQIGIHRQVRDPSGADSTLSDRSGCLQLLRSRGRNA